jgi:hypothetical protein
MSFDLWQVVKGMRIADFPAFESSEISELLPMIGVLKSLR